MLVLGIETSCDETAVSVVKDGRRILSSIVSSQIDRHRPFGGVVPEIAAREHVTQLLPVLRAALGEAGVRSDEIDLIGVTDSPGLQAALLCGVAAAEALGVAWGRPVLGVNHIEAHLSAPFLARGEDPRYPLLSLVVSGGHTHLFHSFGPLDHRLLGATVDDAAGEAFDKIAKMLGLGFPGGPAIQKAAMLGNPLALPLKKPTLGRTSLDFSFSGLKTAVLYACFEREANGRPTKTLREGVKVADVAASFQSVVVDVLEEKVRRAVARTGTKRVALGGGVACNSLLRERMLKSAEELGFELWHAPNALCADNAAMVAARAEHVFHAMGGAPSPPRVSPRAKWLRCDQPEVSPLS